MSAGIFRSLCAATVLAFAAQANASLIIRGVVDGDLSGGNPKAVLLEVTADIADLSDFGAGSANNGSGTDGEELTFSGSATTGDLILITNSASSTAFFTDNYAESFITFEGAPAFINGDDAVEVFGSGSVIDTYGDPDTNGDGETWDYTDGLAFRTGGSAGAFSQANYTSLAFSLDGDDEATQIVEIGAGLGLTVVPEPASFVLVLMGLCSAGMVRMRRVLG